VRTRTVPRNPYSVLDVVVVGLSKRRRRRRPQSAPSCNVSTASSSPSAVIGSVGHQPLPPLVALALGRRRLLAGSLHWSSPSGAVSLASLAAKREAGRGTTGSAGTTGASQPRAVAFSFLDRPLTLCSRAAPIWTEPEVPRNDRRLGRQPIISRPITP